MAYETRRFNASHIIPIPSQINQIPCFDIDFFQILAPHIRLGLPKGLIPVGLPVKIFKALISSSVLAT